MAKFYGPVGYSLTKEIRPGVFEDKVVEHSYMGDVLSFYRRSQTGDKVIDDVSANTEISIISDRFAFEHFPQIKYVKWMGVPWTVMKVEAEWPRLRLSIGGVYNGETDTAPGRVL